MDFAKFLMQKIQEHEGPAHKQGEKIADFDAEDQILAASISERAIEMEILENKVSEKKKEVLYLREKLHNQLKTKHNTERKFQHNDDVIGTQVDLRTPGFFTLVRDDD